MVKKILIAFIVTINLILSSVFLSFAGVTAAIDISAYDTSIGMYGGIQTRVYYNHYDTESDLIPINMNENSKAFLTPEEDTSSLVFINRKGETVIPANPNWKLVAGFRHGAALVKDKASGEVLRIDTSGNILGTIDVNYVNLLPEDSQYSYYYIVGNGSKNGLPKDNFSVVFIDGFGEKKEINLKNLGFHSMDNFDKNGKAVLSTGSYRGVSTSYWFDGTPFYSWDTYNLKQTAYMDVNGNIVNEIINDNSEQTEESDKKGIKYVCDVYTLKRLEEPYYLGYGIYQNDIPTGVMLYDVMGTDNHTVIGHELVERVWDNGNHYYDAGRLMMYHIY